MSGAGVVSGLIPATVLTGFLGAGKSTLLRHVLTAAHGQKIAVIENEFGAENIDSEIIVVGGDETVQMSNGCICCSIRDDLRATLHNLSEQRRSGALQFDKVIIETTGLADPGPVAQTFFLNDDIAARYRPDSILTIVDARHAPAQLSTRREARRQVGFADRIFISKADLVTAADLEDLTRRLRQMNPYAPQALSSFGEVTLEQVFDIGGFNLNSELELAEESIYHDAHCAVQKHEHNGDDAAHHHLDDPHHDDVKSFVFRAERPFHGQRFSQFMNAVVNSHGTGLLRYKGILHMQGYDRKVVLQGVHQLMSHEVGNPWQDGEARLSKLVFIGIDLPREVFLRSLEQCLV
jgi:G3E family GTPase